MMTREERAKQFQPFDAMKGLQEALRDREEHHTRVTRHEISDEARERNSAVFARLERAMLVRLEYYRAFHDVTKHGLVTFVSPEFHYLRFDNERIFFEDIYDIRILEEAKEK